MRLWLGLLNVMVMFLGACSSPEPPKIALIAPFEGQYRAIGYNALYASQMAIRDAGSHMALMAVDDGGSVSDARARWSALQRDDTIAGIIVVSPFVGDWESAKAIYYVGDWTDETGGMPDGIALMRQAEGITYDDTVIVSQAILPDEAFREAYLTSASYTPEPNLLASLIYDYTHLAMQETSGNIAEDVTTFEGRYHVLVDDNGAWRNRETYTYTARDFE
jgi:hypothetical protein